MKKLIGVLFAMLLMFSFSVMGQEVPAPIEPSSFEKFMMEWYWVIGGLILVWEYLVGIAKTSSNSTIEMVLNFLKMMNPKK